MKLFDPDRPRDSRGELCYCNSDGRPIAPLPSPIIEFYPEKQDPEEDFNRGFVYRVGFMLMYNYNTAKWFFHRTDFPDRVFNSLREDLEKCLREDFGWSYSLSYTPETAVGVQRVKRGVIVKSNASAEELGL
jgi:hypothetical protein